MEALPGDMFNARVQLIDGRCIMLAGAETRPLPGKTLYYGSIIVRYAVSLLAYPAEAIMPYMVYDDFQQEHHGFDALTFMRKRGDAFPRADVMGYRLSDGAHQERFLKELDLARPLRVAVFPGPYAVTPLAALDAAVCLDPSATAVKRGIEGVSETMLDALPTLTMNPARVSTLSDVLAGLFS